MQKEGRKREIKRETETEIKRKQEEREKEVYLFIISFICLQILSIKILWADNHKNLKKEVLGYLANENLIRSY